MRKISIYVFNKIWSLSVFWGRSQNKVFFICKRDISIITSTESGVSRQKFLSMLIVFSVIIQFIQVKKIWNLEFIVLI